jgi:hypothetical protein
MLPKIAKPTKTEKLPSTGAPVIFRPMKYREEKVLLMAREGNDPAERGQAVLNVVEACLEGDTTGLTVFDVDYLFVKIRAASISDVTRVTLVDQEDGKPREFVVNLTDVGVPLPVRNPTKTIKVDEDFALVLQEIPAEALRDPELYEDEARSLVRWSIKEVWQGEKRFDLSLEPRTSVNSWIEDLDLSTIAEIREWITNAPRLNYVIEYKNDMGSDRRYVLSTLSDFFTL